MISHLADAPFFLDELAALHAAEWKHLYADWDERSALAEFLNQKADASLPATLVLHEGMELVGIGECGFRRLSGAAGFGSMAGKSVCCSAEARARTWLGACASWYRACGCCGSEAVACFHGVRRKALSALRF